MPALVKLIHGAADAIRKMQEELNATQKVPFPDAPGALTLYHGSPHAFDQFDFENNLRKGEGALAYGPGGYMTGNRPLAEHYATALADRIGSSPPQGPLGRGHLNMQLALKKDPDAALAWLLGKEFTKADERGLTTVGGVLKPNYVYGDAASRYEPQRVRELRPKNTDEFRDAMESTGANISSGNYASPNKITGNRIDEVLREGSKLRDEGYPSPTVAVRPTKFALIKQGDPLYSRGLDWADPDLANRTIDTPAGMGKIMQNLRALAAARDNRAGPSLVQSMGDNGALRFGPGWRDKLASWDGNLARPEAPRPNIYEAKLNASPNDMLMYDLPLSRQSGSVRGALSQLGEQYPDVARLLTQEHPDNVTGGKIMRALPQDAEGMRAMRESGIPATAYLRAGPRAGGVGLQFNPEDYNFVIHNQDILDMLTKSQKAKGGLV